ncbi:MAG: hypothetical protein CVT82_04170 [Alphaproteobacteria bacterium HGW-Alphaproteobacteria-4]|jgi:hypothetical protein|nr:MAG: hypothetical protein CVT82_04170 [Alphaproteobacteria bacterium HGW-Alphaproteobacteria-4]
MEIISRADAKARGLHNYFTGVPCKNGHVAERYVAGTGPCVVCDAENQTRYKKANPDKTRAWQRAYRERRKAKLAGEASA